MNKMLEELIYARKKTKKIKPKKKETFGKKIDFTKDGKKSSVF